jgi:hypothetical protein
MHNIQGRGEIQEDIHVMLSRRANEKLLNNASYKPPKYRWPNKVYYARVEANLGPLWKIGLTSGTLHTRYCKADRKIIWEIATWQYVTREEAEAYEREILMEFADCRYRGTSVLRSGGASELFTRDVLELDKQDDIHARIRRERLFRAAQLAKTYL